MQSPRVEMPPGSATKTLSSSKGKGPFTAFWLTIMMAAQSFKKRTPDGELHTAKAIQEWIQEAKDVVSAESME
jgi:hypothetical protein